MTANWTADQLRQVVAEPDDPLERLHVFAVEYYRLCQPTSRVRSSKKVPVAAMADFAQQLLTEHPKEAAQAFVPLVALFEQLLDEAATAGRLRAGLDHRRIAGVVLQAIMFNAFAATISGPSGARSGDAGEELWGLLLRGIAA